MDTPAVQLRPLEYGGILDRTIELYKDNFPVFLKIAAVVAIPTGLLQLFTLWNSTTAEAGSMVGAAGMAIMWPVFGIARFIASGAMTYAVSEIYLGRQRGAREAYRFIGKQFWGYVGTMLLMLLLWGLGIIGLCIGMYILIIYTTFTSEVFIVEGKRGWAAITRSMNLVTGHFWRVVVLGMLIGIFVTIVSTVPLTVIQTMQRLHPSMVLIPLSGFWSALSTALTMPLTTTAMIVLYFDVRVRKEAFDLEVLANHMHERTGYISNREPLDSSIPAPDGFGGEAAPVPDSAAPAETAAPSVEPSAAAPEPEPEVASEPLPWDTTPLDDEPGGESPAPQ